MTKRVVTDARGFGSGQVAIQPEARPSLGMRLIWLWLGLRSSLSHQAGRQLTRKNRHESLFTRITGQQREGCAAGGWACH